MFQEGVFSYVSKGPNRWAAAHVWDVAKLYRLVVERELAGECFNVVGEEGVSARDIATVIGEGLGVPVVSLSAEEVPAHFDWLGMFAGLDMPASGRWTSERLNWHPEGRGLIADLCDMDYERAVDNP